MFPFLRILLPVTYLTYKRKILIFPIIKFLFVFGPVGSRNGNEENAGKTVRQVVLFAFLTAT